ncbi:hypothetical protein LIER_37088 [Lithospermum erythrorhizon]|uniref:Helitron helicase-like domain-containing protein n=1 Tax=Lithospermum erythrorhizon TaxID=34254 RepID=A0AAV3PG53_LITER
MRLDFLKNNQKKLIREYYQGVVDSVVSGLLTKGKIGTRVYLPATFIGGPRDMRHRYLDCVALVQEFGRPDLFVTMTCNPNWLEIKELLKPGEEAQNRPNLLARVLKAKLSILNDKIMSGEIFGKIFKTHAGSLQWKLLGEYLAFHFMECFRQCCNYRINSTEEEARDFNFLYKEFPKHYVWDGKIKTWTRRKRGTVIGRLSVVNPVENERYYLIIFLSNVVVQHLIISCC